MVLVKILKRKDASSIIVAILIAMVITQPLTFIVSELAAILSGIEVPTYGGPGGPGWQGTYLHPIVTALLQLLVLEIIARIVIAVDSAFKKK